MRMLVIILLVSIGCGGQAMEVKQASQVDDKPKQIGIEARLATAYSGPKIRVAVGEFKEMEEALKLFKEMGWSGVAPSLTDQITTGLVQTGRVAVLERQQINKVVGNLALESEGSMSKYFNKKTTAKTGKLLGAQAILIGAVTQFEPNVSGGQAGISIPALGSLSYHQEKAVVGIDVRLVDQESGKVLVAAHGIGEIDSKKVGAAGKYSGVEFGGEAWTRTPLGLATRTAAENAIAELVKGLKQTPWEGKIFMVKGEKVYIEAGHDLNLRKGDKFRVIHRGEEIKKPDGTSMGFEETEGGWVTLNSVQQKLSIGRLTESTKAPKKGDIVRLPIQ
jgi:curli biogenesis system outer membrane secretion channel CsgG